MRVLLSTYGSRGDVEPLVGLAVRLRALGAEVRVCAPPDFAELLARVGVPLVPVGQSAHALTTGAPPPSSLPQHTAELIASQFDAVTAAAEGCDALVATGMMPAAAGARSVAEKLGIRSVSVTFQQLTLPSPRHPPLAYPGRPFPPEVTDNRVLWDLDAQSINALFGAALNTNRASIGLPPVDNVRDYVIGDQPWLATDLILDAGTPPVYVGFGSMPMRASTDIARVAIEAIRAQGRRALVARSWAGRVADLGIGAAHDGPTPTTESLSAALAAALTQETRARARAVASTIRTDGATVAATLLLDEVSRERTPAPGCTDSTLYRFDVVDGGF
ncbi:MAG: glycosyltransferase [Pseudonocardiaceae bacterium]